MDSLRNLSWATPPEPPALGPGEVHLWRASLQLEDQELQQLAATLAPEEMERAARFRFPKDRVRFTAARGILRRILGYYTGRDPADVAFGYHPGGKPFLLEQDRRPSPLEFNLAHSHGMALYAFGFEVRLGVDLERVRGGVNCERLAARYFTSAEVEDLQRLPPEDRDPAFFRAWTRKEAFLKGLGQGLRGGLSTFQVALDPGSTDALLAVPGDPAAAGRWRLTDVPVDSCYCAALAVESRSHQIRLYDYSRF